MEVHFQHEIQKAAYSKESGRPKRPEGKGFGVVLDETMADTSKTDTGIRRTPVVDALAGIGFNQAFSAEDTDSVLQRTEKLLDTLDEYREKLQDPEVSLEEISPLIRDLELKNQDLQLALNSLDREDGLKRIVRETMITSSTEIARFNRGDYGLRG